MPCQHRSHRSDVRRQHWSKAKRRLCDVIEEVSVASVADDVKLETILPALLAYARALAEQRDAELPGSTLDELVSTLGERCAIAAGRLDLTAPPAQQVTYLDSTLRHGLADACRNLDPLGRGPRRLRQRYEAALEAHAELNQEPPDPASREQILDDVVGVAAKPALRLLVGHGMTPPEAVGRITTAPLTGEDPAETVVAEAVRARIAEAIASHPDDDVRDYLHKVAAGVSASRPVGFHDRLGPTLPALLLSLLIADADEDEGRPPAVSVCR